MDFVSDQLLNNRRIRGLTIIDVFSRYCHGVELDTSITGIAVVRVLDRIGAFCGYPRAITVDNEPEFTSKAMRSWAGKCSALGMVAPSEFLSNQHWVNTLDLIA